MRWDRLLLLVFVLAVLPLSAPAGLFFHKAAKPDPANRVPELLVQVKTDGDENKRVAAAEELRQYDANAFPDMVPILMDVLLHDDKPSVRSEAAQTLGKLRPINQQAGWALEQALSKDTSMRVRMQARSALLMYHMSGYHGGGKPEETPPAKERTAEETASAGKTPPPPSTSSKPPIVSTSTSSTSTTSTSTKHTTTTQQVVQPTPPAKTVTQVAEPTPQPKPVPQMQVPAQTAEPPLASPALAPALAPPAASEPQGPDLTPPF